MINFTKIRKLNKDIEIGQDFDLYFSNKLKIVFENLMKTSLNFLKLKRLLKSADFGVLHLNMKIFFEKTPTTMARNSTESAKFFTNK